MKQKIESLVKEIESAFLPAYMEEVMEDYYSDEGDFSDYDCGNFDDSVGLGTRIGSYKTAEEIIAKLKEILNETN